MQEEGPPLMPPIEGFFLKKKKIIKKISKDPF